MIADSAPAAAAASDSAAAAAQHIAAIPSNGTYPDFSILTSSLDGRWSWSLIEWLHTGVGLEWWAAVAGASLLLRCVTIPLFLTSVKTGAWMAHHYDGMMHYADALSKASAAKDQEVCACICCCSAFTNSWSFLLAV